MSADPFADLLGTAPPTLEDEIDPAPHGRHFSFKLADVHEVNRGVTIPWLCQAFKMHRTTVESKLAGCPVLRTGRNGSKVYDLRNAASYLVDPRLDIAEYMRSLEPKDLPEQLRSEYWSSRLKEQKARQNAGDLWLTEDVQAAFGDIFKLIKDTAILWTDSIDETHGLTDDQRSTIDDLVRELLFQIGEAVAGYTRGKRTPSQAAELGDGEDVA